MAFVEIDKFCQKVLKKHWPGVPIYDDIKKIQWVVTDTKSLNDRRNGRTVGEEKEDSQKQNDGSKFNCCIEPVDLLTGGFPCQPFSCAGKRAGTEDDHWLWPEMLRAIHEVNPRWIVAENVPGLLTLQDGMVFEGVCADLEVEGYEVIPLIIPACAQGALHRRDRVWIVGYSRCSGRQQISRSPHEAEGEHEGRSTVQSDQPSGSDCHAPDTDEKGSQIGEMLRRNLREECKAPIGNPWQEHWYAAASRLCRVDDGISNRVDRLKCLGNAIVPQIALQIFKAIKEFGT